MGKGTVALFCISCAIVVFDFVRDTVVEMHIRKGMDATEAKKKYKTKEIIRRFFKHDSGSNAELPEMWK